MNIAEAIVNLMSDKGIRRSSSTRRDGQVENNILRHYTSYCHDYACGILIDGNKELYSPELIPKEITDNFAMEERTTTVADINRMSSGIITQVCEVKVRQAPISGKKLKDMICKIASDYSCKVNILIFHPVDKIYMLDANAGAIESMGFRQKDIDAACNFLVDQKEKLNTACLSMEIDPITLSETIEISTDYISYNCIEPTFIGEFRITKPIHEGAVKLADVKEFLKVKTEFIDKNYKILDDFKLSLPESKVTIKYTPLLLMKSAEPMRCPSKSNSDVINWFNELKDKSSIELLRKGKNPNTRQVGGKSFIVDFEEPADEFALSELLNMGKYTYANGKLSKVGVSQSVLEMFGIGLKEKKKNYKINVKDIERRENKAQRKRREEALALLKDGSEELYQEEYTPLPMSYSCWVDEEVHYLNEKCVSENEWLKLEEIPSYNQIDEDARAMSYYLEKKIPSTNLAHEITKYSNVCSYLARNWGSNSKSHILKIPIRDGPNKESDSLYGFVFRGTHFSGKNSAIVSMVTVQFIKKSEKDDEQYRHYSIFSYKHPSFMGDEKYIALKRHGTTLMKIMSGMYAHRSFLIPVNCLSMGLQKATMKKTKWNNLKTKCYTGFGVYQELGYQDAVIMHSIEQFFGLIFAGSQCSSFLAEMRRCAMAKEVNVTEEGECFYFNPEGKSCINKAQDSIINNPFVLYLAMAWNYLIDENKY